jgi:excisionase family DNA binding protein
MLTTAQAAAILQVSRRRVEALISASRLPAQKFGRDWLIRPEDLELVKVRRPGRPPVTTLPHE